MAKTTRKKKEPAITPDDHGRKSEAAALLHMTNIPETPVSTVYEDGPVIASPQEPAPEKVIPDIPQPENAAATNGASQQLAPPAATYEVVEAKFRKELTRLQYEQALQALIDYEITEDNLAESQNKLTRARRFLTRFEEIKSTGKAPALAETRYWDKAFNELQKPLAAEISKKQAKLNEIAQEQARKRKAADDERERVENIKTDIDNFIIRQSQVIAECKTNADLVNIQKMIGSHKAAKTRYAEFLPDLVARCEPLNDLIKEQKKTIDALEKLEKEKLAAEEKGDDRAIMELEDKKDNLISEIAERKVVVQEVAINQATKSDTVEPARQVFNTIGARRTVWKAMLVTKPDGTLDQKELANAFKAGLLKCEIDPEKTRTVLGTLKSSGSLKDKTEIIVNGIRYYEEKVY